MVMDTEYPVYFTFTSTFTSGSWWIWFCKVLWCSWTVHLSIGIYPMVFVNLLQLLYTNRIYWRTYVIYHTKIVLDRKLVCIFNIYTICLLLYHIYFAVGIQKVQYISSSQNKTLINHSCQTWPTLNQVRDDLDPRLQLIADPAHCRSGSSFWKPHDPQMSCRGVKNDSNVTFLNAFCSVLDVVFMFQRQHTYIEPWLRYCTYNWAQKWLNHIQYSLVNHR